MGYYIISGKFHTQTVWSRLSTEQLVGRSQFTANTHLKLFRKKGSFVMSKYDPLRDKLLQIPPNVSEKTMTFSEIENILGFELPGSAYNYRPWWSNLSSPNDHPYAQSWLSAGWKVDTLSHSQKWVRFRRVAGPRRITMPSVRIPVEPLSQMTSLSIKIVIQCAGSKFENAGRLTTLSGEKIHDRNFVFRVWQHLMILGGGFHFSGRLPEMYIPRT
ncbi:hypothetical protein D4S03_09605 [bacterium]|nr:MAG: hypothetical protein D4S03_09605 [bacterium]